MDPGVRQRQASDPAASVWVAASAGTGKTKVLTDRVLRLLLVGTPPHRILCLTFTKAAAAEMSIRIGRTLGRWAVAGDDALIDELAALTGERPDAASTRAARRLFARVIDCPGGMKIQTIHAFCQSLLRRFPLEAGIAPHFEVMEERTAQETLAAAETALLTTARADPEGPIGRAVGRLTRVLTRDAFAGLLRELAAERGRLRRILEHHGGLEATIAALWRWFGLEIDADESAVLAAACRPDAADESALARVAAVLAGGTAQDGERGALIQAWLATAPADRPSRFGAYRKGFLTDKGEPRKRMATKRVTDRCPQATETLESEANRLVALDERLRAVAVATASAAMLALGDALVTGYRRLKDARARLDFDDLIIATCDLLSRPGIAPWVLFKLDGGLDHILIDEAQDTNPEQWQVVTILAEEFFAGQGAHAPNRTVFAVGDEKQSIFSFQRADPAEFARMRRFFAERVGASGQRWQPVALDISFRSTAAVLSAVDTVFANPAARAGVVADPGTEIRHRPFRRGQAGEVALWPLVVPEDSAPPDSWQPPLVRENVVSPPARLAAVIAATIRGWLDSGERLPARDRPLVPGDIMVLVRRRTGFVAELVRALKARAVPVAGVDRMVLAEQISVMDLLALADFLLLPDDDLTLAVVLKGPLIGLTDDELFPLAFRRPGSLWAALVKHAEHEPALRPARGYLGDLLARTDFVPPFELLAGVLGSPCPADTVSGRRALLRRLGAEARDPLDELLAACLTFQRSHPPSLQLFLDWLRAARAEIKREQDQGDGDDGGVVRIMTVHGSKGLQAPVVFVPDTAGVPRQVPTVHWPEAGADAQIPMFVPRRALEDPRAAAARATAEQRRDEEYRRLLYVAITRAEDRLVVCGWQGQRDVPADSWYRLVEAGLASAARGAGREAAGIGVSEDGTGQGALSPGTPCQRPPPVKNGGLWEPDNKVLGAKNAEDGDEDGDIGLGVEPHWFDFRPLDRDGWTGLGHRLIIPQTAQPRPDFATALRAAAPTTAPPWVWSRPPAEAAPPRALSPSQTARADSTQSTDGSVGTPDAQGPDAADAADGLEAAEPALTSPLGADDGRRFQRGLIIHTLLQTLPELPQALRAEAAARHLARAGKAWPQAVQEATVAEVMAVLNHPDFAPLFAPGSRAEVPVVGRINGRPISGQIDRLAVTETEVLIIDYKTNRPVPDTVADVPPLYLRQMGLYRLLLGDIYPDRPVRCVLLWTDVPRLMALPETLLERAVPRGMRV